VATSRLGHKKRANLVFVRSDTQGSPRHHPYPSHSGEAQDEVAGPSTITVEFSTIISRPLADVTRRIAELQAFLRIEEGSKTVKFDFRSSTLELNLSSSRDFTGLVPEESQYRRTVKFLLLLYYRTVRGGTGRGYELRSLKIVPVLN
jgi:hypothetical protein